MGTNGNDLSMTAEQQIGQSIVEQIEAMLSGENSLRYELARRKDKLQVMVPHYAFKFMQEHFNSFGYMSLSGSIEESNFNYKGIPVKEGYEKAVVMFIKDNYCEAVSKVML